MPASSKVLKDSAARKTIETELDRSMLVEAAAGTGKTTMLIKRMVALLAADDGSGCASARNLAAVTFTRKAASELRTGFQIALEKAAIETGGERKERLGAALENIDQCFIGTIHSFCARLLRERPVEAGVDLEFEELDDKEDARIRKEAWDLFFDEIHSTADADIAQLSLQGVEAKDLQDGFLEFASYPDVEGNWPVPDDSALKRLVTEVPPRISKYVEYMKARCETPELLANQNTTDALVKSFRRIPQIIEGQIGELSDLDRILRAIELFQGSGKISKKWPRGGLCELDDAAGVQEDEYWKDFCHEVNEPLYEARYAHIISIYKKAEKFFEDYKEQQKKLNFQDLLMKARDMLSANPAARQALSKRYTHLLVDEFQDTDPIQAEVMFLLAAQATAGDGEGRIDWRECEPRPGSLFVVGDPKQSIYRFRRADISTYNLVKSKLCPNGSDPVRLTSNFRSVSEILDWVNDVFSPEDEDEVDSMTTEVMLKFPAKASDRSPEYIPLDLGSDWVEGALSGIFYLTIPDKGKTEDEADLIARIIRYACNKQVMVSRTPDQVEERKNELAIRAGRAEPGGPSEPEHADYSDFMIIARNSTKLHIFAHKLKDYNIPHRVTGGTAMNKVPELRLLHLFLKAADAPQDKIALLAVLRSGLFGISDASLYSFKKAGGSFSFFAPVPDVLEAETYAEFASAFKQLRVGAQLIEDLPPVAAIESIIGNLGLMAWTAAGVGGDVNAGSLAKAVEVLRSVQAETWTTTQVVEYLSELIEARKAKDPKYDGISALSLDMPAVRLMNLHQVKGLQAPVVFLADASGEDDFDKHPVTIHVERAEHDVKGYMTVSKEKGHQSELLAVPPCWKGPGLLEETEEKFQVAENLRLRYVAATRAGSAMVITTTQQDIANAKVEAGAGKSQNPWGHFARYLVNREGATDILSLVPVDVAEDDREEDAGDVSPAGTIDPKAALETISSRLSSIEAENYGAVGAKEHSLGQTLSDQELVRPAVVAVEQQENWATSEGLHGVEWGSVIHKLLELAPANRASLEKIAGDLLAERDLDVSTVTEAADIVESVIRSDLWKRSFLSTMRMVEVPFEILVEEEVPVPTIVRGSIDLAFKEDGGWVIVDYKADSLGSRTVEEVTREYAPQVRFYAKAWSQCTGEEVIELGLFFVKTGQYVVLS